MSDPIERLNAALEGRYLIERELGEGGMATVYLAEDLKHHRKVAIKVLSPDLAEAVGGDRFLREIEVAAGLTHPHILPLHDSGEADGLLYYVMPHVEGESLRQRLEREKQLPIEDAVRITREIADALAFAHEHGVLHRDVKPGNILLEAGHAVLADFGIAGAVAGAGETGLTGTGMSLGTPAYMSPEQATGEQDLDGRSDQYALGCVLYEMLAGRPPFSGRTVASVVGQHVGAEATPVGQVRPSVPEGVAGALDRALAKTPADRFRTTAEFQSALAVPQASTAAGRRIRWKPAAIGAGVAAAAVAAVALATSMLGPSEDAGPPSIAVVPQDALADDVGEEIQMRLQPVSGLSVKAFYEADEYSAIGVRYEDIGEALGAEYLLRVSVQEEQERDGALTVRVNAQLILATAEEPIWSERYERPLDLESRFTVYAEIAERVAQELDIGLAAPEREAMAAIPTRDSVAWEYFQEGERLLYSSPARAVYLRAAEQYERAVAQDPSFALAYARLALVLVFALEKSRGLEALDQARRLDPDLPELRPVQGAVYRTGGQYEQAAHEYRALLVTRPSDGETLEDLGLTLRRLGRWPEALEMQTKAVELSPLYAAGLYNLARSHLYLQNYAEADRLLVRYAELAPEGALISAFYLAWLKLVDRGDVAAAEQVLRQAVQQVGLETVLTGLVGGTGTRMWFHLPDFGFREDLRAVSATDLGGPPYRFYWARAVVEESEGDTTLAREYYDSALTVMGPLGPAPRTAAGHGNLGMIYAALGQGENAVREAEEGVRLRPISADALMGPSSLFYLARTLVKVGEYERAIELFDSLLSRPSEYSITWLSIHPFFEPLWERPSFQALLEKYADDVEH